MSEIYNCVRGMVARRRTGRVRERNLSTSVFPCQFSDDGFALLVQAIAVRSEQTRRLETAHSVVRHALAQREVLVSSDAADLPANAIRRGNVRIFIRLSSQDAARFVELRDEIALAIDRGCDVRTGMVFIADQVCRKRLN